MNVHASLNICVQGCGHLIDRLHHVAAASQGNMAAGEDGQSAGLSSQIAAPTHVEGGIPARDMPSDACMQDTASSGLEGTEGSMCPSSSPTWATTIPDGCGDDGTSLNDKVCITFMQCRVPRGSWGPKAPGKSARLLKIASHSSRIC